MYRLLSAQEILVFIGLVMLISSDSAFAEYRVTAFEDTTAYKALIDRNAEKASAEFGNVSVGKLDFAEANNFCVLQIIERNLETAIESCELALEKAQSERGLSRKTLKSAKASIYSNRAVARALSGDFDGANQDLESALGLNAGDVNANRNYETVFSANNAVEVAQSL